MQEQQVGEHLLNQSESLAVSSSTGSTSSTNGSSTAPTTGGATGTGGVASSFHVVGAIGKQCVGKSSLLNRLAGRQAFKIHSDDEEEILLKHVTKGVDLHVTAERLLLLDSQVCYPCMFE